MAVRAAGSISPMLAFLVIPRVVTPFGRVVVAPALVPARVTQEREPWLHYVEKLVPPPQAWDPYRTPDNRWACRIEIRTKSALWDPPCWIGSGHLGGPTGREPDHLSGHAGGLEGMQDQGSGHGRLRGRQAWRGSSKYYSTSRTSVLVLT